MAKFNKCSRVLEEGLFRRAALEKKRDATWAEANVPLFSINISRDDLRNLSRSLLEKYEGSSHTHAVNYTLKTLKRLSTPLEIAILIEALYRYSLAKNSRRLNCLLIPLSNYIGGQAKNQKTVLTHNILGDQNEEDILAEYEKITSDSSERRLEECTVTCGLISANFMRTRAFR